MSKTTDSKPAVEPVEPRPSEPQKDVCQRCGQPYGVWFAPNEVWNAVMHERIGMLCPNCFIDKAEARRYQCTGWELRPAHQKRAQEIVELARAAARTCETKEKL